MASYKNLVRKIINNPKDVRFTDIERILRREGFLREPGTTGSHFAYDNGTNTVTVVKHGKKAEWYSVEAVIEVGSSGTQHFRQIVVLPCSGGQTEVSTAVPLS